MIRLALICFLFSACIDEKNYCGTIIEKGYEQPTSGHKTHTDPCYFLIMQVDSINKSIRINVTIPTWYSLEKGSRACFELSEMDLDIYGNGRKHLIK